MPKRDKRPKQAWEEFVVGEDAEATKEEILGYHNVKQKVKTRGGKHRPKDRFQENRIIRIPNSALSKIIHSTVDDGEVQFQDDEHNPTAFEEGTTQLLSVIKKINSYTSIEQHAETRQMQLAIELKTRERHDDDSEARTYNLVQKDLQITSNSGKENLLEIFKKMLDLVGSGKWPNSNFAIPSLNDPNAVLSISSLDHDSLQGIDEDDSSAATSLRNLRLYTNANTIYFPVVPIGRLLWKSRVTKWIVVIDLRGNLIALRSETVVQNIIPQDDGSRPLADSQDTPTARVPDEGHPAAGIEDRPFFDTLNCKAILLKGAADTIETLNAVESTTSTHVKESGPINMNQKSMHWKEEEKFRYRGIYFLAEVEKWGTEVWRVDEEEV